MTAPTLGYRPESRDKYERLLSLRNIAKRILSRRWHLGLSQDTLGRMAGTKQSKISEIEMMKGNPTLKTLDRIARELGLVIDLVPLEIALKGTPFERPETSSIPEGFERTEARRELVAAGTSRGTLDDEPGTWLPLPPDFGGAAV